MCDGVKELLFSGLLNKNYIPGSKLQFEKKKKLFLKPSLYMSPIHVVISEGLLYILELFFYYTIFILLKANVCRIRHNYNI